MALLAASVSVWLQFRQDDLDYRLIQAIKLHQTAKAIALLSQRASANARDAPYEPLTLRTLVPDLWARLRRRKPPREQFHSALMLACNVSIHSKIPPADTSPVRALLSNHADPNASDGPLYSPLVTQIWAGNPAVVKLLLEYGAQPNREGDVTPLMWAVVGNRVDLVKLLLEHGAAVNAHVPDGLASGRGVTALYMSQHSITLDNGATALHLAVRVRYMGIPMLDLLCSHGADVDARDDAGQTPMMCAADLQNLASVRFLLRHGADASVKNKKGRTALDLATGAAVSPDKRAIERLLADAERAKGRHR